LRSHALFYHGAGILATSPCRGADREVMQA
jgi:hypothetical protein